MATLDNSSKTTSAQTEVQLWAQGVHVRLRKYEDMTKEMVRGAVRKDREQRRGQDI